MTHALLDGLRTRFRLPTHPDVAAFHEGFADLVAMLMHFSYSDVVHAAIERSGAKLETDALLLSLASQFGHTTGSGGPLRSAINTAGLGQHEERSIQGYDEAGDEPHARGSLLVTAIFEAFATVLRRKTKRYLRLARSGSRRGSKPRARRDPRGSGKRIGITIPFDLHTCHRLLPAVRPAIWRISASCDHGRLRSRPRRPLRLSRGHHRCLRAPPHLRR